MDAQVTVRYWAGARRAAGRSSEEMSAGTVAELLAQLSARPAMADVIAVSSILVDSLASQPETILPAGSVVDVLPPFAGG